MNLQSKPFFFSELKYFLNIISGCYTRLNSMTHNFIFLANLVRKN